MRKNILLFLFVISLGSMRSQEYSVSQIDPELLVNADAVIRNSHRKTIIKDLDHVVTYVTRVVTILNEEGERHLDAYQYYGEGDRIKSQEALIFDAAGEEVKKIKKKDFEDQSAYGSSTLFSDSRVSYLDYTPRSYPYTVKYTSEFIKENSVFLTGWYPFEAYGVSVENSVYELENPMNLSIRYKEENLDSLQVVRVTDDFNFKYSTQHIPARKNELLSPSFLKIFPHVVFSLDQFSLEGVEGQTQNWNEFGKWMYDNLVAGRDRLPDTTIKKVSELTKDAKTLEEKARIIYQYVQDNTRYISVQYGIGGWEPATAMAVDQLGYGDCKALTNYTHALLKSQGIESYYTVIYGGGAKRDINPDFTKMEGNHVILNIPREDSTDIWLECTSQTNPFDYIGGFTDDRFALKISNKGGEIIKTKKYSEAENIRQIECNIQLNSDGGFEADFSRSTSGVPYGNAYYLAEETQEDLREYYRGTWRTIQNIEFENIALENDREAIELKENLKFTGERLTTVAGNRLLIPLNFIQQQNISVSFLEKRTMPLHLARGRTYKDHFVFNLPEGFEIESLPESQSIKSEFGNFSINITAKDEGSGAIEVDRFLVLNEGDWPASRFIEFQLFIRMVNKLNNLKAVIVNNAKS
ncbi:DUF3857 domain-containing protein [Christiangramia aquimixticola]|uniref:DUF3857 domain-containing protein n=1 Tax=Christiangramia aquimixticola TaxID=1697558 RepID=UPI003AA91A1F